MNLQPLYDVKERLEAAAIAGTNLLGEDFRLRRAAEGLQPLAAASPVFGKISAGLDALLKAPAEKRAGLLLDVLSLVDAVAYTQAPAGKSGDLTPLSPGCGNYQPLSYSQLQPLLSALTGSGGGRIEVVKSAWENHPEYFSDFRVLPALAAGLGDSYGELADLNANILKGLNVSAAPFLKQGFDPAGRRDMVRRVEVIAGMEGPAATPWLREVLPEAKKDVRTAVLLALGNDAGNAALLLDLAKAERGKNREAVLEGLAKLDGGEIRAFWQAELEKNSQSVYFLRPASSDWSIELVASGLRQRLEHWLFSGEHPTREDREDVERWIRAVGEKDSPVMLDFWHWADEHMDAIGAIKTDKDQPTLLGVALTDRQIEVMRRTGPGPLREFCLHLWERRPDMTRYLYTSLQAALLSLPAEEVYEKYAPYLQADAPGEDAEQQALLRKIALRALGEVSWQQERGCYVLTGGQPTAQPLDRRWYDRLVRLPGTEGILEKLIRPEDPELCAKIGKYIYHLAITGQDANRTEHYIRVLCSVGWTDWKDFFVKRGLHVGEFIYLELNLGMERMPAPLEEKIRQLNQLSALAKEKKVRIRYRNWPEKDIQRWIAQWTIMEQRNGGKQDV